MIYVQVSNLCNFALSLLHSFSFLIFSWQMRASASNDVFFPTDQMFMRRETVRVVFRKGGISYRTKQRRTPTLDVTNEQVFLKKKITRSYLSWSQIAFTQFFFLHELSLVFSASCQKYTKVYKQPVGAHLHLRSLESSKVPDR